MHSGTQREGSTGVSVGRDSAECQYGERHPEREAQDNTLGYIRGGYKWNRRVGSRWKE